MRLGRRDRRGEEPLDGVVEPDLRGDFEAEDGDGATATAPLDVEVSGVRRLRRAPARRQSLPLRLALGGAVVFVVGLLVTAGAKGYRDLGIQRQREAALAVRLAASEERIDELRHRLELLRDDPATLERLAREELGLVGKDDIVFVLPH